MKKVLVIEDNDALRRDLLEILSLEAYEVIGATNGRDGILLAEKHEPHLIICDVNMPVLNGFGVIAALQQNRQTASIPVIFLSARYEQDTVNRGVQLGAIAYLTKPFILSELLETIGIHIRD
ncbi:MAG: response regulator [Anaerolineae bacterium]|nr:response regulator [Anaerolineae bacterium]